MSGRRRRYTGLLIGALICSYEICARLEEGRADKPLSVGVIQYNVKGGQGGWTNTNGVLGAQVRIIVNQMRSGAVDFVALEQASANGGQPGPLISDKLTANGLPGWSTLVSLCYKDATQIAFSTDWDLAAAPLLNGTSPQRGWRGCEPGMDGRPYNIAYFKNRKSALSLIFVVVHLPHCSDANRNAALCLSNWNVDQFKKDFVAVLGSADHQANQLIVAGDMNELGGMSDPNVFSPVFPNFGKLQISSQLLSCCNDSNWIYSFDRILSNSRYPPTSKILEDGVYPLNPGQFKNEEHKAIYGTVTF